MDGILVFFFVPVVIFLVVVAPIWLFLHYRSKTRAQGQLSESEREELDLLLAQADRMTDRIETLESILDAEAPGWRRRPQDGYGQDTYTDTQERDHERAAGPSH